MPIKVFILVFTASPLDYARYRHTALYLELSEPRATDTKQPIKSSLAEVVGSTGFYSFSERVNWEIPTLSTGTLFLIHITYPRFPRNNLHSNIPRPGTHHPRRHTSPLNTHLALTRDDLQNPNPGNTNRRRRLE